MAGLLDQMGAPPQAPAQAAPQTPAPPSATPDSPTDAGNVSPQEQQVYDAFMHNALNLIYSDGDQHKVNPNILAQLRGAGGDVQATPDADRSQLPIDPNDPKYRLATTAVAVVKPLYDGLMQSGAQIDDQTRGDVLFHAGAEIIGDLAQVCETAGIHDFNDKDLEGAFYLALDMWQQAHPEDKESLQQGWQQINAAGADGTLNQILPGLPGGPPQSAQPPQGSLLGAVPAASQSGAAPQGGMNGAA